jgi:predicted nucleic acid-binding protein
MKVVDASVLVEHLVGGEYGKQAKKAVSRERSIWAPVLVDAEVGNALRKRVRKGQVSRLEADQALVVLRRMHLQRVLHQYLVERAHVELVAPA